MDELDDLMVETIRQIQTNLAHEQDLELMKWLGVDTKERAIEVIQRLEELNFTVQTDVDPINIRVLEDEGDSFKIEAEADVHFKLVPIKP